MEHPYLVSIAIGSAQAAMMLLVFTFAQASISALKKRRWGIMRSTESRCAIALTLTFVALAFYIWSGWRLRLSGVTDGLFRLWFSSAVALFLLASWAVIEVWLVRVRAWLRE